MASQAPPRDAAGVRLCGVEADLDALLDQALNAGRECVVAAVILDSQVRAFTPRRSSVAAMLPGLWDLVGGHVEPGESLLAALTREVAEETGWSVRGEPALVFVSDWEIVEGGRTRRHREFDFVADVVGDLSAPRLRHDEHDDFRWVDAEGLDLFDENDGRDRGLVRRAVEVGVRCAARGLTYPHVTLFVSEPAASEIDGLRRLWDPAMAAQIAPHVTVAYPDEVKGLEEAVAFLDVAAKEVGAFEMELGGLVHDGDPGDGLFLEVEDIDGQWKRLRTLVATHAPRRQVVPPHVTVVHPRTSGLGKLAWAEGQPAERRTSRFAFRSIAVTAFDRRRWRTVAERPLGGGN